MTLIFRTTNNSKYIIPDTRRGKGSRSLSNSRTRSVNTSTTEEEKEDVPATGMSPNNSGNEDNKEEDTGNNVQLKTFNNILNILFSSDAVASAFSDNFLNNFLFLKRHELQLIRDTCADRTIYKIRDNMMILLFYYYAHVKTSKHYQIYKIFLSIN